MQHNYACISYLHVYIGIGWGDPHYVTFDQRYFDFQDRGDFILLEVVPVEKDVKTGAPVFILQGRLDPISSGASVHRALAFGDQDLAFQVSSI